MAKVLFNTETRGTTFRSFDSGILRTPFKEVWLKDVDRNLSGSGSVLVVCFSWS